MYWRCIFLWSSYGGSSLHGMIFTLIIIFVICYYEYYVKSIIECVKFNTKVLSTLYSKTMEVAQPSC